MVSIISFIRTMFAYLGRICNNHLLLEVAHSFPKSLFCVHKPFSCEKEIIIFVVCPKCSNIEGCAIRSFAGMESQKCSFVEFPEKSYHHLHTCNWKVHIHNCNWKVLSPSSAAPKREVFNDAEFSSIERMYAMLYPRIPITHISRFYNKWL